MRFLYTLSIILYSCLIRIAAIRSSKAKLWVQGRKKIFKKLQELNLKNEKVFWFHAASLGEFEQGRPVIERLKKQYPEKKILLTFFSPSGFEIRKNYEHADYVFYLPADTWWNAKKFVSIIKPEKAFFIKYEFWFNYLYWLHKSKTPIYLISGIFRRNQHFFKFYGIWFKKHLKYFQHFFIQNQTSYDLSKENRFNNITLTGDTRYDRVNQISNTFKEFPTVEIFAKNCEVIVCGSTWSEDEEIVLKSIVGIKNIKLIIAPHQINENHLKQIEELSKSTTIRLSKLTIENALTTKVIIVDNIGQLSYLYRFAKIAYIGGGFGKGIHNILEAACYGIPVVFGPKYQKFQEAKDFIENKAAFSIANKEQYQSIINNLMSNQGLYDATVSNCLSTFKANLGATDKICSILDNG